MTAADKAKLLALVVAWRLRSTDLAAKYLDGYPRGLADAYKVVSDELRAIVAEMETPTRRLDPEIDMLTEEETKRL